MNHLVNRPTSYQSPLREEQKQRTREQILEGLVRTMAGGITEVSIPAVARAAGVSVPTVYRHFPTKKHLIDALGAHLARKAAVGRVLTAPPSSPEDLISLLRGMHVALEHQDEAIRAAAVSELGTQLRKEAIPARLKMIEHALAPVRDRFDEQSWQHLCRMVLVLGSTAMVRAFKDYLDLSGEASADVLAWAIRTLTRGSSTESRDPDGDARGETPGRVPSP